ncbi:MAG: aminotransferase class V-fold PLP-dependent enzyme [bacterium]|nr:aminotransferase class V-fold PLP-dependent enzyme [bacterium]
MLNFTVGPVQSSDVVRKIGADNVPYFRTTEFSEIMLENERLIREFVNAPDGSRVVFITGSGTASMEATVMNVLMPSDYALVVNGGSFGQRFCKICDIHGVLYDEIRLETGKQLRLQDIEKVATDEKYTAFLVNKHETSTGVHYDMRLISEYCKRNGLLLIVDNISSFLCDEFNMEKLGTDVMITGSQKALACPPGISIIVLSPRALERVEKNNPKCMYFDLKDALANQTRGQTPFTPAVGTLLQINARLKEIDAAGGVEAEVRRSIELAVYFRSKIKNLPLEIVSESLSNAVTPLHPTNGMSAYDIFLKLKDEHGIWVCPNGGEMKDRIFRVGHMGCLNETDYDKLVSALKEVMQ